MKWRVLATDFDGTLALDGIVPRETRQALEKLRASGMHAILVTGRELADFAALDLPLSSFDLVVAENGAVLLDPASGEVQNLAAPPPENLISELLRLGVAPLSVGSSVVATREPCEHVVLEVIKKLGLEYQVIFNKGAVMLLPPGVNKASGLRAALHRLRIAPAYTVAAGDGENDHAMLDMCGLAVAVADAVPSLKERAGWVTTRPNASGLAELMDAIRLGELNEIAPAAIPS